MRLFLAIELPEEAKSEIRRRSGRLRADLPQARWVKPDLAHLTLQFYGEVEEDSVPVLRSALENVFAVRVPFAMRLQGAGTFPPGRPAHVAWIGVKAPSALQDLQRAAAEASREVLDLESSGRPFHGHVTLARCRRPWSRRQAERFVKEAQGPWGDPFEVTEGVLIRSRLGPRGPRYEALARLPLDASPHPSRSDQE